MQPGSYQYEKARGVSTIGYEHISSSCVGYHEPRSLASSAVRLFGTTALFGGTTSLFGFTTLFRITHIKDLNFVLLTVTRDKLAEDTVTQTKVQPVETWEVQQAISKGKSRRNPEVRREQHKGQCAAKDNLTIFRYRSGHCLRQIQGPHIKNH
ncbi:hypothetical protein KIN20_021549 [Parelaphostrongylus tenuis]|uniref:Uncharacterized protein n=1 Tax=Parelaphostrongylus tenuis TaxID=148309 RepID=A0AAD5MSX5_PARTN|nr:hypothetical protein KIN20_021549 [Parelaphostrongylus tenuis]